MEAHEPEALAFCPLLQKAWRMFRTHLRFLVSFTLVTTALSALTSQALSALVQRFDDPMMGATADVFNQSAQMMLAGATSPHKVNLLSLDISHSVTVGLLSVLMVLIQVVIAFSTTPVFVHVVIGDHLGRRPGSPWLAMRQFWMQLGTMLATCLLAPLMVVLAVAVVANSSFFDYAGERNIG